MRFIGILAVTLVAAGSIALVTAGVKTCGPGGDGVVARFDAANGEAFLVIQKWNDWFEPYTVSLFVRTPEGRWGWCYIDHQSDRLQDVVIEPSADGNVVTVRSDGRALGRYDIIGSTFSLFDDSGRIARTLAAPQEWQDPPAQYLR